MSQQKTHTLRSAITKAMLFSTGIVMLLSTSALTVRLVVDYEASIHTSLESVSQIISQNLIASIVFNDEKEIQKTLLTVGIDKKIKAAALYNAENLLAAQYQRSQQEAFYFPKQNNSSAFRASGKLAYGLNAIHYCSDVINEGKSISLLCLQYDEKVIYSEFSKIIFLSLIILILGVFTSYILSGLLQKPLLNAIYKLLNTAKEVRITGKYDVSLFSNEENLEQIYELELLKLEFSHMLQAVQSKEEEILDINKNLEKTVEQRTHELEKERAQAIEKSKLVSLGEMAGGVAHEINNPLAIIDGLSQYLLNEVNRGSLTNEKTTLAAQKISNTSKRISKIISGLRSFARDGANDPFEKVSITSVIYETLSFCEARIKNHSILLKQNIPATNIDIECRSVQISQILLNLLNNSVDAIDNTSRPWISLEVKDKGEFVEIAITDSGSGIPKEIANKIMQPFFTTKPVGKGTGLGLSIVNGIVKTHHGHFYIDDSSPNTRFVIELPKKQPLQEIKKVS